MQNCNEEVESIGILRKKLLYRSTHRGTQEMDLILGRFAKTHLSSFSEDELKEYQLILDTTEDPVLYQWITGQAPVPQSISCAILRQIIDEAKA